MKPLMKNMVGRELPSFPAAGPTLGTLYLLVRFSCLSSSCWIDASLAAHMETGQGLEIVVGLRHHSRHHDTITREIQVWFIKIFFGTGTSAILESFSHWYTKVKCLTPHAPFNRSTYCYRKHEAKKNHGMVQYMGGETLNLILLVFSGEWPSNPQHSAKA